jgi:glutathione S-transferase
MGLTPDEAAIPKARSVFAELARLLREQPFFAGEAISLADLFVRPQLLHPDAGMVGARRAAPGSRRMPGADGRIGAVVNNSG